MSEENLNENADLNNETNAGYSETDRILKQIPIFSSLKDDDIVKIREIVEEIDISKGVVIFNEGEVGDAFYIIVGGKVKVTKKQDDGSERTLAVFRDGDFFGEMALIEDTPRTASAIVIEECVLYKITKMNFEFVMRLNPAISLKIMRYMSERVRASSASGKVAEKEAKIITLFSPKGGIGKSMIGVNLAHVLSKDRDNKVFLLDLDLEFGDFSKMIDKAKNCKTIIDLLKEIQVCSLENMGPFFHKINPNLSLLAAPDRPEEAELVKAQAVKEIIEVISGHYDYIIIDTATSFTESTLVAMDAAWRLLFVLGTDFISVKNSMSAITVLKNLEYDENLIYPVLNMCGGTESELDIETIEKYIKLKINHSLPFDYNTAVTSIGRGEPYVESYPNSKLTASTIELVNKMCNTKFEVPKAGSAKDIGGIFKSLFGGK